MRSLRASALRFFFFFNGRHMVRGVFCACGARSTQGSFPFVFFYRLPFPLLSFFCFALRTVSRDLCVCVCVCGGCTLAFLSSFLQSSFFFFFLLLHNGRTVRCHRDSKSYVNNCSQKKLARWQRGGVRATVNCTHVTTIFYCRLPRSTWRGKKKRKTVEFVRGAHIVEGRVLKGVKNQACVCLRLYGSLAGPLISLLRMQNSL